MLQVQVEEKMSTEIDQHYFRGKTMQTEEPHPNPKWEGYFPITFYLCKVLETRRLMDDQDAFTVDEHLSDERTYWASLSRVKRLTERSRYKRSVAKHLYRMKIPEVMHPFIMEDLFHVIDDAVSDMPIAVLIHDVTVQLDDTPILDGVITESMEAYEAELIPATKSSIEDLKKARLVDSLELEAVITQTPSCAICLDRLDHLDDDDQQPMRVTRLPCSHSYHEDCIVHWLEINHVCPLCRCPMPTAQVEEPSEP